MRSVADDLRRTATRVLEMPTAARIELALALGDDDLERFARTSGSDRDEEPYLHARRSEEQPRWP